jgi:hypothetical protein
MAMFNLKQLNEAESKENLDPEVDVNKAWKTIRENVRISAKESLGQCCPTYLYIGAHLTDGCGGAGAVWRFQ